MCAALPQKNESLERQLEILASALERHALTHVEYSNESTHVVLKREPALSSLSSQVLDRDESRQGKGSSLIGSHSLEWDSEASISTFSQQHPQAECTANQGIRVSTETTSGCLAADEKDDSTELITAPLVGLAYRAREPGAAPFVEEGDWVDKGAVLCLIEAMKMFNEVKAPHSGRIHRIHYADGALVEYGSPLISLEI